MANQTVGNQKKSSRLDANQSATDLFLTFSLESEQKALLPTHQLLEIVKVRLSQITAIAGLAPSVMGIYNWRGDVVWIVDLASLLGYTPLYAQDHSSRKFQDSYHILFLRSQEMIVGFAVHHVGQMVRCDPAKIQSSALAFRNAILAEVSAGYWLDARNEALLVLDGKALVQNVQ